jgi:starch-binding outer membrane protein, SusD/RagB family
MFTKYLNNFCSAVTAFTLMLTSCKKFVVADPPINSVSGKAAFSNDLSAIAVMTSVYNDRRNFDDMSDGTQSIGLLTGMGSDELTDYASDLDYLQFYTNTINSQNKFVLLIWKEIYAHIHTCNIVLEGLDQSTGVNNTVKQQLIGEAKFMRAFLHFYGVNLFGKIPLVTTSDYRINNIITRSEIPVINKQILQDLKDAQTALPDGIVDGLGNNATTRVRPNKWAATALLARFYLYQGDWANAEAEAIKFATKPTYGLESDLNKVFLSTSTEAIWQLQPSSVTGSNTLDGIMYVLNTEPGISSNPVALSDQLVNKFESGDARFADWLGKLSSRGVDYYYPYKYKINTRGNVNPTEYTMVLRLAEQYLILAEAKIQQGHISDGIADLNTLRRRARLLPTIATPDPLPDLLTNLSKEDALNAVVKERQTELFAEWGHRWFDLKRTNTIDAIMTTYASNKNNAIWDSYKSLWPIPLTELQFNSNLSQNDKY